MHDDTICVPMCTIFALWPSVFEIENTCLCILRYMVCFGLQPTNSQIKHNVHIRDLVVALMVKLTLDSNNGPDTSSLSHVGKHLSAYFAL